MIFGEHLSQTTLQSLSYIQVHSFIQTHALTPSNKREGVSMQNLAYVKNKVWCSGITLTGKKFGGIGPPGMPSCGGI